MYHGEFTDTSGPCLRGKKQGCEIFTRKRDSCEWALSLPMKEVVFAGAGVTEREKGLAVAARFCAARFPPGVEATKLGKRAAVAAGYFSTNYTF